MTQVSGQSEAARGLVLTLDTLRRRRRWLTRWTRLGHGLWLWVAGGLTVILWDAVLPLPPAARCGLAVGLGVAFLLVLARLRLGQFDPQRARLREARVLEAHLRLQCNELVNGAQLAEATPAERDHLTVTLAARAVRRAGSLAQGVEAVEVISSRAGRRPLLILLGLLLVMASSLAWDSDLLLGGAARLVDPWGDHPPFSLTKFKLRANPAEPKVGEDVTVQALVHGRQPAAVQLVMFDAQGHEISRWPMIGADRSNAMAATSTEKIWERRLRSVHQPVTMRVQASERSYSRRFTLTPIPPPPEGASGVQAVDGGNAGAPASQPRLEVTPSDAATLAMMQELAAQARRLEELSRQLSGRLQGLDAETPLPEWLEGELEELDERLRGFNQRSEWLKRMLERRLAQPDWLQEILRQCQEALNALECNKIGSKPGRNQGVGQGTGGTSGVRGWTAQVAQASAHDARLLNQQSGRLGQIMVPLPGGSTTPQPGLGTPPMGDLRAVGVTVETGGTGSNVDPSQAWMSRVPSTYRDLVARYFQSIAQDREP